MRTSFHRRKAFTLIEMMMAITIFSIIIAAIYSTWYLIIHATQVGQRSAAESQRARIAIHTIEDSLISVQSFQASMKYYSFVVQSGDSPVLSYAAKVPGDFPRNSRFNGLNLRRLTFTLEGGDDAGRKLVLRQNPILMDMDGDEKTLPLVLAYNVQKFEVECWDKQQSEWVDDWDNTNSIPGLVRLTLRLGGKTENGTPVPVMDCVRLISIPSITLPAVAQGRAGGGGAFPPAGAGGIGGVPQVGAPGLQQ
jgi:prepilin-type N-terminal cleavage/methylation domain-containing protein